MPAAINRIQALLLYHMRQLVRDQVSALSLVPVFIIFVLCQKYIIEGISTSGLKG